MTDVENKEYNKFERAQRRVLKIKGFYKHVVIFIIINGALLLSKDKLTIALLGEEALGNTNAMNWIDWNIYIWLIILAIHALFVFGHAPSFIKKWEDRQMKNFIKEEQEREKYK